MLDALSRAGGRGETRLTHVAIECNLPYDRFKEYLAELQETGLVDREQPLRLTSAGRALLASYKQWMEGLRLFGIGDAAAPPDIL